MRTGTIESPLAVSLASGHVGGGVEATVVEASAARAANKPYAGEAGGPVVVGVDGTFRSVRALRWGADEARRRNTDLVAVHACEPVPPMASYAPVHPPQPEPAQRMRAEAEHLAHLVRDALGTDPPVRVRRVCEPTSPIRALLAQAAGASLLVLATSADLRTGRGIGSTALACVRHAPCPVVVLPSERRA